MTMPADFFGPFGRRLFNCPYIQHGQFTLANATESGERRDHAILLAVDGPRSS